MKDPASVAKHWADRVGQSTQKMTDGVNAVTQSPMAKAAANKAGWLAGIQQAAASSKWEAGLNRRSLQDWKTAMISKGVGRVASGALQAVGKQTQFYTQLLPFVQQQRDALNATPRGGLETNLARMMSFARGMATFKRT